MSVDSSALARTLENTISMKLEAVSKGDTHKAAALQHCVDALLASIRDLDELPVRAELASCRERVAQLEVVKQNLQASVASIRTNLDKSREGLRAARQEAEGLRLERDLARNQATELRCEKASLQTRLENVQSSHEALVRLNNHQNNVSKEYQHNIANITKACHQSDAKLRARISELEAQASEEDKQRHKLLCKVTDLEAQVARRSEDLKQLRAERRNERRKASRRENQQPPAYEGDDAPSPPPY